MRSDRESLRLLGSKEPELEELKAQRFYDKLWRGEGCFLPPREETEDLPGGVEGAWGGTRVSQKAEVLPGFNPGGTGI